MKRKVGILLIISTLTIGALAQTWTEQGDAGDLPTTAQIISSPGATPCRTPVTRIQGFLSARDADMYVICITDPDNFAASTVNLVGFDTQLFLFRCDGVGVVHNDDTGVLLQSTINNSPGCIPSPGVYLLAITRYNLDPADVLGQLLWNDAPFNQIRCPDGPGRDNPMATWTGASLEGGLYTIALQGAYFVSSCQSDLNQDGVVDDSDLLTVLFAFGSSGCPADVNRDGIVDDSDLLTVLFAFGSSC
ncbi:MAG: hypothetical protein ABDI19_03005 [Armatimonadota bacterium]